MKRVSGGHGLALRAFEFVADEAGAAFGGDNPGAVGEGGIVADVAGVAALEVGNPMLLFVLVKTYDFAKHCGSSRIAGRSEKDSGESPR